jgi:hypothetical protein
MESLDIEVLVIALDSPEMLSTDEILEEFFLEDALAWLMRLS